jgi:hypothetical protein
LEESETSKSSLIDLMYSEMGSLTLILILRGWEGERFRGDANSMKVLVTPKNEARG